MNQHKTFGVRLVLFLVLPVFVGGCVTVRERGDRSFEAKRYDQAALLYDEAIEKGDRDPQLYLMAARTALFLGDPGSAERHYSRSLRNGGGVDVAKEFADFYIRTSNFGSAARVYRYLLNRVTHVQPIYNNLGTALMYAGSPMDAESYLMVAQQMNPKDPFPYVNLGLLYDQYLNRPSIAAAFYSCFTKMSKQTAKVRDVQQRIQELEREFRGIGLYEIACGQVFTFDKLNRVAPRPEPDSSSDMGKKKEVRAIEIVLDENGEGKEEQESTGPGADTLGEEGRIKGLADQSRAAMLERARSEESAGDSAAALAVYETCYSAHRDDASFRALIRLRTANEEVEEVRRLCEEKGDLVKSDETLSAWCHSANEIE